MKLHDRITPFVGASLAIHVVASIWYVVAFDREPRPIPMRPVVHRVNLVEQIPTPKPKAKPPPVVQPKPREKEKAPPKKIPETIRPQEQKKIEKVEPKKEPAPEKAKAKDKRPEVIDPEPESPPQSSGPVTVEAEDFPFGYYLSLIQSRVGQYWSPPSGLVGGGEAPQVTVRFEIDRNGKIIDPKVVESSGISFFDLSAMRAVQKAGPFPPLPAGFKESRIGINFIFHYEG